MGNDSLLPILVQSGLAVISCLTTLLVSVAFYQLRRVTSAVDKFQDDVNQQLADHATRITVIERQIYTPQERREIIDMINSTKHIEIAVEEMRHTNRGLFKQIEEVKSLVRESTKP